MERVVSGRGTPTQRAISTLSPVVSFLNAVPAPLPASQAIHPVLSAQISYVNGAATPLQPEAIRSILSANVAFLNGTPLRREGTSFLVSALVSYERQGQQQSAASPPPTNSKEQ
jgi:hypothetical protein